MLCITLLPSEYFIIGDNTVVQFDRLTGERVHLIVNAPREVPILRGTVLERQGGKRPDCVLEKSERYVKQLHWNHAKKQALNELREILGKMDDSPEILEIREKVNIIFPETKSNNETT